MEKEDKQIGADEANRNSTGSGTANDSLGTIEELDTLSGIANYSGTDAQWDTVFKNIATWKRLIARDLNMHPRSEVFPRFTKGKIIAMLENPESNEKLLRSAIRYIYGASSHFRRLIQYFVSLSDFAYVVEPYGIDPSKANIKTTKSNYRKVLKTLSAMSIKTQFPKILTVCLREDVFYGTFREMGDNIAIQQLNSDYCRITEFEGNVANVTFNFSYFSTREDELDYYPEEFRVKYEKEYLKDIMHPWITLSAPNSFAIKLSADIWQYALPLFAGILGELYDIEEYKKIALSKAALENYAMLLMKLPMTEDGNWGIDLKKAKEFWGNLDAVLPEEIGSILSPMPLEKISFERNHADENDTISNAEQNLFTAAGVSSLIFNNPKASANALLLSIKADQNVTYGVVKSIEDVVNRYIQSFGYGRNFKVNFLDVSCFNRKEAGDAYLKACQFGIPMISYYCASQGLGQAELDSMSFLEGHVLKLQDIFRPLQNSSQMGALNSGENNGSSDEGGAPQKDIGELTDSGEQSREDSDDWG